MTIRVLPRRMLRLFRHADLQFSVGLTVAQARALLAEAQSNPLGNLVTVSLLLGHAS